MFVRESFVCFQFESEKSKNSGRKAVFAEKDVVLAQKRCFEWDFLSSLRFADVAARSKSFQNSPFADSNPYVLEFKFALVVSSCFPCVLNFNLVRFQQGDQHDRLSSELGVQGVCRSGATMLVRTPCGKMLKGDKSGQVTSCRS